jgi:UDP-N-acetylglucosamine transferase subunit ALG13
MIFVTVGSMRFDALIQTVDELAGQGQIGTDVMAQIGNGSYVPRNIKYQRYFDDLQGEMAKYDLVICHGGIGTTFQLLRIGVPFVAVPNRALQDDHQSIVLEEMVRLGWCRACWHLEDLAATLRQPPLRVDYRYDPALNRTVWQYALSAVGQTQARQMAARSAGDPGR